MKNLLSGAMLAACLATACTPDPEPISSLPEPVLFRGSAYFVKTYRPGYCVPVFDLQGRLMPMDHLQVHLDRENETFVFSSARYRFRDAPATCRLACSATDSFPGYLSIPGHRIYQIEFPNMPKFWAEFDRCRTIRVELPLEN